MFNMKPWQHSIIVRTVTEAVVTDDNHIIITDRQDRPDNSLENVDGDVWHATDELLQMLRSHKWQQWNRDNGSHAVTDSIDLCQSISEWVNEWINEWMNEWIKDTINRSINEWINQKTTHLRFVEHLDMSIFLDFLLIPHFFCAAKLNFCTRWQGCAQCLEPSSFASVVTATHQTVNCTVLTSPTRKLRCCGAQLLRKFHVCSTAKFLPWSAT